MRAAVVLPDGAHAHAEYRQRLIINQGLRLETQPSTAQRNLD